MGRDAEAQAASVRKYVQTFRAVLDFAGVDPNPAKPVRLPREERAEVDPPSAAEVETIIATATPKWRLPLRVLAETGMRVGELHALAWADVDESGSRFRVGKGKTAAARRWVAVPEDLMREVAETCPREDRTAERSSSPDARRSPSGTRWLGPARTPVSRIGIPTTSDTATPRSRSRGASR